MDKYVATKKETYEPVPPDNKRWIARSEVKSFPEHEDVSQTAYRTQALADSIEHVGRGQYIYLYYANEDDALRDRSCMENAHVLAGWMKGLDCEHYRMYATSIESTPDLNRPWRMQVKHLHNPVKKITRKRRK